MAAYLRREINPVSSGPSTVSVTISQRGDASGKIIGAARIARGATEQEFTLESCKQLAAIVLPDVIVTGKDLNGAIQKWNASAEDPLQFEPRWQSSDLLKQGADRWNS